MQSGLIYLKTVVFSFLLFTSVNSHSQITATTPNKYFSIANFEYFSMPTETDVIDLGSSQLQVIISSTPTPTLHWDDYSGHTGILSITGFSGTVFMDDVTLLKPISGNGVIAVISARVLLSNNTTDIVLLCASWNGSSFSYIGSTYVDNRGSNFDWFDRASIATYEAGVEAGNRQEIVIVWQKNDAILLNEGYYSFSTNTINWYNNNVSVFNGAGGTFRHPDIAKKSLIYYAGTNTFERGSNIIALQTSGNIQNLVNFCYLSNESSPTLIPVNSPVFTTLYSTTAQYEELRTPRVLSAPQGIVSAFNKLDNQNKKSYIHMLATIQNRTYLFDSNTGLESACTGNLKYKYTGFPQLAFTQSSPTSLQWNMDYEVVWQQMFCSGIDFCSINAVSKRYSRKRGDNPLPYGEYHTIYNDQFFYISSDLNKNTFFPSIAAIPNEFSLNMGLNFYSFGVIDKATSLNGQIGYKKTNASSGTLFTEKSITNNVNTFQSNAYKDDVSISRNDQQRLSKLHTYPNPAHNFVDIAAGNEEPVYRIEIYNVTGILIRRLSFSPSYNKQINVSNITNGYYYLKIYSGSNTIITRKIAIIH